jgi:cytochrome c peroxidase
MLLMKNIFFVLIIILPFSCNKKSENNQQVIVLFKSDIILLTQEVIKLEKLVTLNATIPELQKQFLATHESFKKVEPISEYYFPTVSKSLNGPALDEFEEDEGKTIPPQGFQVIEEIIFSTYTNKQKSELLIELGILKGNLKRLDKMSQTLELTNSHIFDIMRLQIFRIITLGITGFDSPIAQNSIPEAKKSLETIQEYYTIYANGQENDEVLKIINDGKNYLIKNNNFNNFDRAYFILKIANPLSKSIYKKQEKLNIPIFNEVRGLRTTAQTLFDKNVFDPEAFSGFPDYKTTSDKIELGKLLFNDVALSGNNSRSCASCHYPEKAFTDGVEKAVSLDGKTLVKRNTPTLANIAYQRVFFADSRVNYLEDQTIDVISNETEMHGSMEKSILTLKNKSQYVAKFKKAFPNKEINEFGIKNALASYIRSLSNYNSKFDAFMRNEAQMTYDEKAGFNLFAGKGKCATCHFIPLTNGTVPPNFDKSESEVLGVPDKSGVLDADLGKFNLTKATIHKNSFKTPTIRNIALTAPYMHNGVYKTLEEVVEFYNKGGGLGLGFNLENQTLPSDKLNLSVKEKQQIIAYMKTLTDKKYTY